MARRLKFLTDEQVLAVAERTGYRPQGDGAKKPPAPSEVSDVSQLSDVSQASDTSQAASAPSAESAAASATSESVAQPYDAQVSDEAVVPLSPAVATGKEPGAASGTRRRSGSRGQSSASVARRSGPPGAGGIGALIGAAFVVPILLMLLLSGGGRTDYDSGGTSPTGPARISNGNTVSAQSSTVLLQDLLATIQKVETRAMTAADRATALRSARSIVGRLERASLSAQQKTDLAAAEPRLAALEAGGGPQPVSAGGDDAFVQRDVKRVEESRVEQAWSQMAGNFERILWLCLSQPRSPLQQAAEAVRGVDLRQHVSNVLRDTAAKGPDGIASLVGAEDLHPVLGVGGYDSLLREASRFPEELRAAERWQRWKAIIPRFEELCAEGLRRSLRVAKEARRPRADSESARLCAGDTYGQDTRGGRRCAIIDTPKITAAAFAARARIAADTDLCPRPPPGETREHGRAGAGGQELARALPAARRRAQAGRTSNKRRGRDPARRPERPAQGASQPGRAFEQCA
ncbi:MAG: hypothetical protein KIT58_02075 [Planctomycetota bacterium]|nr:hypothetical protein [Planctomycetota bacterium]